LAELTISADDQDVLKIMELIKQQPKGVVIDDHKLRQLVAQIR
jgi:hypothetical protein